MMDAAGAPARTDGICLMGLADRPAQALLDEHALADTLQVSPRTVRRMVQRGQLPESIKLGSRRMWVVGKLTEFFGSESDKMAKKAQRVSALYRGAGI